MQVDPGVESIQHDHDRGIERRQGVHGEAHRVDRSQPRVGDQDDAVGGDGRAESKAVTVGGQRRAHAARRLDQPDVDRRVRPAQLGHQVADA